MDNGDRKLNQCAEVACADALSGRGRLRGRTIEITIRQFSQVSKMFLKTMSHTACYSKPHTTPQNAARAVETVPKLFKTSRVVAERQRHLATEKRQLVFNVEDGLRIVAENCGDPADRIDRSNQR